MLELIYNYLVSAEELEAYPCDVFTGGTVCGEDIEFEVDICPIYLVEGSFCG